MRSSNSDFKLIETLTRSTEIVLRRMIRYLVGKISLVRLQEMVRSIYIEEAEDKLKAENPTKNVALTKLALLTGLDTRTLTKIRNSGDYNKPTHQKSSLLRESVPIAVVIDYWSGTEEFFDFATNEPKTLSIRGELGSFERLVSLTVKARGITHQSILDRLNEVGVVSIDQDSQTVELVKTSYLPIHSEDHLGAFEAGYTAAANLMDTIVHNFETDQKQEKFFQRSLWSMRLPESRRKDAQKALNNVLELAESECREILANLEELQDSPDQITAGVNFFYFEDNALLDKD